MIARAQAALGRLAGIIRGEGLRARLARGALGSAGVQAASRALALVLGVLLARTLGPEGYGIYAYAVAIMSLLMVLSEAGVPTLLMREVAAADAREEWGLLRGALHRGVQLVALVSVCISGLGLIALASFAGGMDPDHFWTMALMLLVLPFAALGKTMAFALRGLHRVVTAQALELLLRPALVIALVSAVFYFAPDLRSPQAAMAAQLGAVAVVLLFTLAWLNRATPPAAAAQAHFGSRWWLKSTQEFMLLATALTLNSQIDILMLGWHYSREEVGLYRVATQISALVIFFNQALSAAVAPHFARLYAQREIIRLQRIAKISVYAITIPSFCIMIILIWGGLEIIEITFGAEFLSSYQIILILGFGNLIVAALGVAGPLLTACGYERILSRSTWTSVILNIILNATLIPLFGAPGAAAATAITLAGRAIFLSTILHKRLGIYIFPTLSRCNSKINQ